MMKNMSGRPKYLFDLDDFSSYVSSNERSLLLRVYYYILKGPKNLFDVNELSNYRSSNYMNSTVYVNTEIHL